MCARYWPQGLPPRRFYCFCVGRRVVNQLFRAGLLNSVYCGSQPDQRGVGMGLPVADPDTGLGRNEKGRHCVADDDVVVFL